MLHFGIDLGGTLSQVCIREGSGRIVEEPCPRTDELHHLLERYPSSRVVMETCAEAFKVADNLQDLGHDVRIVPGTLVRQLGVGARGIKTDVRDARVLSDVSTKIELPSVHIPATRMREMRATATLRDALVRSRTMLINTVRGWLRTQLIKLPRGSKFTFTKRVRRTLQEPPHRGVPDAVERQLLVIDELCVQIKAADAALKDIATGDPQCRLLMTVPGVGPLTSIYFRTVVDEVERFGGAQALESYLGLTPGENSSSLRKSRTAITKAGSSHVRRVLVQACWVIWMKFPSDPLAVWGQQVAARRGSKIAIVAMARKLAGILFAIWRDQTPYDPTRVTTVLSAPPGRTSSELSSAAIARELQTMR